MRIAAVVVTHNRLALLKQCVDALLSQSVSCTVLLVDNASDDGTAQWGREMASEKVQYLPTGGNLGGAGGFQFGMKQAVEQGFDRVWVMDDDSVPRPDALEKLLQADGVLAGNYGFLASLVLWTDGRECRMNRQKMHRNMYGDIHLMQHGMLRIQQSTFVSCLFTADVIRRAGLPVKEFFIWGDDIEYTRRLAMRLQLPSYLVGQSVVIHHMATNTGSAIHTDDVSRLPRYLLAYRNEHYLYRQEGLKGYAYLLARCVLHTARVLFLAKDHRLKRAKVIWQGFFKGFSFRPPVTYVSQDKDQMEEKHV